MRPRAWSPSPALATPRSSFSGETRSGLPFGDASFDAVVAGFVVNHLPRPERALAEFARVVRPGGRVAVTVWDRPGRMRLLGVLGEAVEAHRGRARSGPAERRP